MNSTLDGKLESFIEMESQKQRFQQLIHDVNDQCWDLCYKDRQPGSSLDNKTERCLGHCVERFIDTTNFVVKRLQDVGEATLAKENIDF
ncbi:unnamed protein product [Gordionus sp. m RMFG-2023]